MNRCTTWYWIKTGRRALLAILLSGHAACFAQPAAPVNFCGSIGDLDGFELNWDAPAGADPQLNYEIYRDSGAGFVLINLLGPATNTTFTDFGIDVTQINSYYVRAVLNGVFSEPTELVRNIVLSLNAANPSVAQLSWNGPYEAVPATGTYAVYRRPANAPLELRATLPPGSISYTDTLYGFCQDSMVTYFVQYQSDFCNFDSQRREDEFRDLMPPPPPLIETASVDPLSGDIQLYWENVPSPDLNFYRVQDIDLVGQQFVNVGLVNVGEPTEFIYETAGLNGSKTLAVIAFDECGNDASYGLTASTMFTEAEYTECSLDAMVSWTPYEGWPEGLASYLIQAFIDGDGPFLMGEADASATFYLAEVEPNRDYCFYVEAQSQGVQRNATSNRACVVTNYPNISSITYLSSVNVIDNNSLEVNILQDQQAEGTSYELFRARQGGSFISLGVFDQTPEQIFTYVDEGIDARSVKYFYKFDAYDGCNTLIGSSNLGTNIVLDGVAETRELKNYLSWNAYQNWEEGVDAYQIWRKLGNQDAFELYAQVDGNTLIFEDDVEQFREEEGQFCYRIVALESPNSFGISSASISFEDCVTQPPIIWIPSAMVINGQPENQIFKPVSGFIDLDSYRMEIYNKWGQLIFESDDVNEGWDGTFKGNEVREDFFRYIIIFKDGSGKPFVEQDVVYVLKK